MADQIIPVGERIGGTESGAAAFGTAAGFTALLSAAACCVLPLVLAGAGIGAGAFAALVRYHWPLTIFAAVAVAGGWLLYWRRQRACTADAACATAAPSRAIFVMLCVASLFVALSAIWPSLLEQPLLKLLGGA